MKRNGIGIAGALLAAIVMTGSAAAQNYASAVPASGGQIPQSAVPTGREAGGAMLYSCVAYYNGGLHPGKIRHGFNGCNIGYGGQEIAIPQYSVVVSPGKWMPADNGTIPFFAMKAGNEANGEPLYVCRAEYGGGLHPGKIGKSTGSCNITYGGGEYTIYTYEVLGVLLK